MSMMCDTCQVALNSVGQYQQHLNGKMHAKKLKLAQEQEQPQQQQQYRQNRGHGQGRPIRGAGGGRGRGTFGRGGQRGRGRGGGGNFVQSGAFQKQQHYQPQQQQQQHQTFGQTGYHFIAQAPTAVTPMEVQQGPQYGAQASNMEPFVRNAFTVQASLQTVQGGSGSSLGFMGSNQQGNSNSYQLFSATNQMSHSNSGKQFGNHQSSFSYQHQNKQQYFNQRGRQPQRPGQRFPPPKPKKEPVSTKDPLVFGDHMGIVSVSLETENELYCDVCSVSLTSSEQAFFHYKGAKHIKKARIARMHEVGALSGDTGGEDQDYYCQTCNVTVNSADQMKVHKEGAKHKKMEEQRKRRAEGTLDTEPVSKKSSPNSTSSDATAPYSSTFVSASRVGTAAY